MQSPAEIDAHIDLIIAQGDALLKQDLAEDAWAAHHRHNYLRTATSLLADWRTATPRPIQYARFYNRQKPFARALTALSCRTYRTSTTTVSCCPIPTT